MCSKASLLLAAIVACSGTLAAQTPEQPPGAVKRFYADDPLWRDDDMRDIPPPAEHDLSKSYEFMVNSFRDTAKSIGPALNVNTLGEVPDSSWFTNRLGVREMTIEEILRGPSQVDGPAPGTWEVTGRPDSGITPKFTIRDARGDTYLIKLDPASNPELPSSVEIIATKIFHAIGYQVPEDFVVEFDESRLTIGPRARIRTDTGERRAIQKSDVDRWLRRVPRAPDGEIRAIASRYVPGKVVGQFMYTGRRSDDPNDIYPHERRRELRGLRVFAAWLNHDDARSINSIDTYVTDNGRRYIRHYLQDFGSVLGSGSTSAQQPRGGYEYLMEGGEIGKGLIGLGLYQRDWMKAKWYEDPTIGNIEADVFDPATWKTEYPNPAFNQMDAADAFWAASILSRFTDPILRSIVEDGQLTNREGAAYLADVIIKRRDKTLRWAIALANPLDRFAIRAGSAPELTFDNAAARLGASATPVSYRVRWSSLDNRTGAEQPIGDEVAATEARVAVPANAWGPVDDAGLRYAVASIATVDSAHPHWATPVTVTIRQKPGGIDVVGINRLPRTK
jgi:hypothetical protein